MTNMQYGLISLLHHVPVMLLTMFWGIALVTKIPSLGHSTAGIMLLLLPLLFSPVWCVWGMIRGIRRRKERHGIACAVMSAIGLMLFVLMLWGCAYIGSRY